MLSRELELPWLESKLEVPHHTIFFLSYPTIDYYFSCDVRRSNYCSYKHGESLPSYASSATSVSDRHSLLLRSEKVRIIGHALHFLEVLVIILKFNNCITTWRLGASSRNHLGFISTSAIKLHFKQR